MKNLYSNKLTWFMEACYRRVIIYVPCVLLALFVIDYYFKIISGTYTIEVFEWVLDGIKVAATMAALGFYAGYMTTEVKKKPVFYEHGEKLFHATVLLLITSMLQRFLLDYHEFNLPEVTIIPMLFIVKGCLIVFITYATYCLMTGITGFLKVLHWENEEYLRAHRKSRT